MTFLRSSRSVVLALAASVMAGASGCTALYFFNASDENLPCGPDDASGDPRCKDGFACVRADDDIERCVKAGFKEEGEVCVATEECKDPGAVCADAYAERCDGDVIPAEFEIDCARRNAADKGLKCRRACKADFTCGADFRCFDLEGLSPFCQAGTCASDSECIAGLVEGLCVQEGINGGASGLCRKSCDPLACAGAAGICVCADDENCATPPDESVSARAVCLPAGVIDVGETCDSDNFCDFGGTCTNFGVFSACTQWCRVGGGAPACNAGVCSGVDVGDENVGICQ